MVATAPALRLIPFATAAEAAPAFAPADGPAVADHLDQTPLDFLEWLAAEGHWPTAWTFLAAVLPRRELVWWACRCTRAVLRDRLSPQALAALVAAETWTVAPGDGNRRKTLPPAEAIGFAHPAGCVALAAFLSGGSLVAPPLKEVPPPPDACPRAAVGAIQLAAAQATPTEIAATNRCFLDLALAVARGEDRWPNPT